MKVQPQEAVQVLTAAYADRLGAARVAASSGCPVIGHVGNTVPVELIVAAGAFAVQVTGAEGDTPLADTWLEGFYDPDVRAICEQALRGELRFMRALVIPRSTEPHHKLYLSLRELQRLGQAPQLPPLLLYDLPHTQDEALRCYGHSRTQALADHLGELTGQLVTEPGLRAAIHATNTVRSVQQQLQLMRQSRPAHWRGELAQMLNGAARFLAPERYAPLLAAALMTLPAHAAPRGPRLLLKGVPLGHAGLHRLVDDAGAVIVAEDDPWGTRSAWPLLRAGSDPMASVFQHYHAEVPCPRIHPRAAREAWFLQALGTVAPDGVLFHLPAPDDVHGWDYPRHRDELARRGIPHLVLREPQPNPEMLRTWLRSLG